jgi:ATP-dependent Clp protease adaptor protein ClpS
MSGSKSDKQGGVSVAVRRKVKRPARFRVLLYNDDYTTMEFVVEILVTLFRHTPARAAQIMLHVHERGHGVAGVYTFEIAEAKVLDVHEHARNAGHPLRAGLEEE